MSEQRERWTPGPWRRDRRCNTHVVAGADRGICSTAGYMSNEIEADKLQQESEANAHLVAAAPELYEALDEALHIISTATPDAFHNGVTDPTGSLDEGDVRTGQFIEQSHALLARARGEEVQP